jgi:hypothetical protein
VFHLFLCFDSHGPRDAGGPRPTGRYIDYLNRRCTPYFHDAQTPDPNPTPAPVGKKMYSEKSPPLAGAVCGQRKSSVSFTSESEEGGAAAKLRLSSRRVSYRLELPMTTEQHHQALKQTRARRMAMQGALRQGTVLDMCGLAVSLLCLSRCRSRCGCALRRGYLASSALTVLIFKRRCTKVQGVPGYPTCNAIGIYRTRPLQYDRVSRLFRYPCLGEVVESASGGAINDV